MGDHWQRSLRSSHALEAEGRSDSGPDAASLALQSPVRRTRGPQDPRHQDLDVRELRLEEEEEEAPPEDTAREEFSGPQNPQEALSGMGKALEKDTEEAVPETSHLSIAQRLPSVSPARVRKRRRRLLDLAKPKSDWQVLKDRPSVYRTERPRLDTTLTATVPVVSHRVAGLSRPKRFYSEHPSNRTSPIWPIARPTLKYQASRRLRELATPRVRNNMWSINMSEVGQVSRAAQMAIPSPRILWLAKPRAPATLLEEWDPMPKPKPHVSDYSRLLHLAMPKAQLDKCVPDRDPCWEVLDVTKKAVASPRIISLAKPKVRKDVNEGYDRHPLASMSSPLPRASPKKCEWPRLASEALFPVNTQVHPKPVRVAGSGHF
ncbi:testicular haploid expressed gene protein [Manis pentadactyla]|uniref:testicular haploid expressed gene protein n=1 Tax=Manis pentadactyla TaxID=143292 RepID=UPI00255C6676|nr:testicular haploid expressed gene protein [Manis pentadactyla]